MRVFSSCTEPPYGTLAGSSRAIPGSGHALAARIAREDDRVPAESSPRMTRRGEDLALPRQWKVMDRIEEVCER